MKTSGGNGYGPVTVSYGGMTGGNAADWFGPLSPLRPQAPPQVAGRRFDYPQGLNINIEPRDGYDIRFHQLRQLADSWPLLRLVIETRKDQLSSQAFGIRSRDEKKRKNDADDKRIAEVMDFLRYPDQEHDWDQWLRMLLEDQLVIDAATIYPRYTNGGKLYALDVLDGATITRKIDDWGRLPMPPLTAYQQTLKGSPAVDYLADDILYLPRNLRSDRLYGYSPVEQIVLTVNMGLRRDIHKLQFYTEGTVPEALIGVPATWNVEQIRQFQEYWDSYFEGNTATRRKGKFVPGDIAKNYVATKEAVLKDEFDEWLARIVSYAFNVSAQWAIKQMNRATAQEAGDQAEKEGLEPQKKWIKNAIDRLLAKVWKYADLEAYWPEEAEIDQVKQMTVLTGYQKQGNLSIDEVRAAIGEDPLPKGQGANRLIYTATGAVTIDQVLNPPEPPGLGVGLAGPNQPQLRGHNGGAPIDEPGGRRRSPRTPAAHKHGDGDGENDDDPHRDEFAKGAPYSPESELTRHQREKMQTLWTAWLRDTARRVAPALAALASGFAKAHGDNPGSGDDDPTGAAAGAARVEAAVAEALKTADWDGVRTESAAILGDQAAQSIGPGLEAAAKAVTEFESETGQSGFTASVDLSRDADVTKLANPRAVAWAQEHAAEFVSGIDDVTRGQLRDLIVQAQAEGWSVDELRKSIVDAQAFSPERAALVARMEIANSSNRGNLIGWQAAKEKYGIEMEKRAILGMNENHCVVCLGNVRAGAIPLDDPFPSGQLCPTFHVRCYCGMVPVVKRPGATPKSAGNTP